MRLPAESPEDDDDEEQQELYPEVNLDDINEEDELDSESRGNRVSSIPFFRSIRRGTFLDIYADEDGNWYPAEVKKLDNRESRLFVSFLNTSDTFDRWVDFDNRIIARINTYTYGNNGNFKVGQVVEYNDTHGSWNKAIIIAVSSELNRVQVSTSNDPAEELSKVWISSPRYNIRPLQRSNLLPPLRAPRKWRVPTNPAMTPDTALVRINSPGSSSPYIERPHSPSAAPADHTRQISESSDRYNQYTQALHNQGLTIVSVNGDGNCLFRAVAHQVYGNEDLHILVRAYCVWYMEIEAAFFCQFVEGGIRSAPLLPNYHSNITSI